MEMSPEERVARFGEQVALVIAEMADRRPDFLIEVAPADSAPGIRADAPEAYCFLAPAEREPMRRGERPVAFDVVPKYVYEADTLLVQDEDALKQVLQTLEGAVLDEGSARPPFRVLLPRPPVAHVASDRTAPGILRGVSVVQTALQQLHGRVTQGSVTPNYIVSITNGNLCPADEPTLPAERRPFPVRHPAEGEDGDGVRVLVLDTGLPDGWADHLDVYPWLKDDTPDGIDDVTGGRDPMPPGIIEEYDGHGLFITGVLRSIAPRVKVTSENTFPCAGALDDHTLSSVLSDALSRYEQTHGRWPDIISLSAGVAPMPGDVPPNLAAFVEEVRRHPETVLIAAAGNDASTDPFYPAAFAAGYDAATAEEPPSVVSVGSVNQDEQLAWFTNSGPWVLAYTIGVELVNAFPFGRFTTLHQGHPADPRTAERGEPIDFTGMASWSGTSFSTPVVAGLVAARMSRTKETSRQAAQWLLQNTVDGSPLPVLRHDHPVV